MRIEVRDRGRLIPEVDRPKVFKTFETLASPDRAEGGEGSHGLGLSFCAMAMDAHGGAIGIEPAAEGGNAFFLELPPVGN